MTVEGATMGAVCRADVEHVLGPTWRLGDGVVMDHLSAHQVSGMVESVERQGATVHYLPSDSPEGSPIEPCWSTLRTAWVTA